MRILLLSDINSSHTQKWAMSLSNQGIEIGVFSLTYPKNSNVNISVFFPKNINPDLHKQNSFRKLNYLGVLPSLKKVIREFKPDIIHAHYATSYGLLGALVNFHPYVVSVWGSDILLFPHKSFLHKKLLKHVFHKADEICVTSKILEKEALKYSFKKSNIIPFGINCNHFHPIQKPKNHTFTLGIAKGLEKVYGIDTAINAFSLLIKEYPSYKINLLIVGDGSERANLEELAKQNHIQDKITFMGRIEPAKMPEVLNKMDILLNMSLSESFGVSVLEASACGLAVISSNVGGLPEVVENNNTGFLIEPNNPSLLKNKILELFLNPDLLNTFSKNGRNKVLSEYDLDKCVKNQISIYNKLFT